MSISIVWYGNDRVGVNTRSPAYTLHVDGTFGADSIVLADLTASRLAATDGSKQLASVTNLASWIAGTANEIDIADDGDGTVTIGLVNPLIAGKGGTGAATLTDHGILLGSGTDAITPLGVATNGQIPIGSTGADPVLATPTGTANRVTVTLGAGTLVFSTPQDIATTSGPTFDNLTLSSAATSPQLLIRGIGVSAAFQYYGYASAPTFDAYHANGTPGSETATQSGDLLFTLQGRGYGTTGYKSSGSAGIRFYAAENFTDTAFGTSVRFYTTSIGSTSFAERMCLTDAGRLGVYTTAPDRRVEINSTDGTCLRLSYDAYAGSATNYVDYLVGQGGNAQIVPSGGRVDIAGSLVTSAQATSVENTLAPGHVGKTGYLGMTLTPDGWWKCDDNAANTTVADSSGNGYNMAAQANTNTKTTTGVVNGALTFNGSSDYASIAAGTFTDTSGSVVFWVKVSASTGGNQQIISSADEASTTRYIGFGYYNTLKVMYYTQSSADTADLLAGSTPIVFGRWYHVAVTSDGSTIRMYVNGRLQTLSVVTGGNNGDWFGDTANRDNFLLGALKRTSVGAYFSGVLDDVRVYSETLTKEQVQCMYASRSETFTGALIVEGTIRANTAFNLNGTDGTTQAGAAGTVCDVTALAGGIATAQTQITYAANGTYNFDATSGKVDSITITNGRITGITTVA